MAHKRTEKLKSIAPYFHVIEDTYNGGFRLHTYGDPGDYFNIISAEKLKAIESVCIVEHLSDDDFCRYCDGAA